MQKWRRPRIKLGDASKQQYNDFTGFGFNSMDRNMNSMDFHISSTRIPRRLAIAATMALGIRACWPHREAIATAPDNVSDASQEWWSWRGPQGNNIAAAGSTAPTKYEKENVVWQSPVPGRGHSSPIVAGKRVYLTTADKADGTQSVLAFNRDNGKPLWTQTIHRGGIPKENHLKNTEASPTVAFDGQRLIASFYNSSAIWLSALTTEGEILWQKPVGKFDPQRFKYGYAPSPALFEETVIVAADYDGDSFVAAIDRATGDQAWKTKRVNATSFSSPIVAHVAGRQQLLLSGGESITSYDPKNGKELWTAKCLTMATCGTVVWDGDCVFASGGYPKAESVCVRADGSCEVVWKNNQKCYEQSILAVDGFIYAVTDAGIAQCWRANDGETMWRERLGGKYSCSPILVGDVIQIFNEQGQGFAFKASPTKFESVGGGKIADDVFATPAVAGDTMYMRIAKLVDDNRQEYLVALR